MKRILFLFIITLFILTGVCSVSRICAQGVGINSSGNPADPSAMLDVSSANKGTLITRMTTEQRNAISSPAEALQIFNTTTKCFEFFANGAWQKMFCSCTTSPPSSPSTGNTVASETKIAWNWNPVAGATAYKYSAVNNFANAIDNGTSTSYNQSSLNCNTSYTLYVWAYSACGISSPATLSQTTETCCADNTWSQINQYGGPGSRTNFSTVWDAANNRVLLFGGYNNNSNMASRDLWSYSPSSKAWTLLNPGGALPSKRSGHSAVWDSSNNRMLVFGGLDENWNYSNELWAFSPSGNTWSQLNPIGELPAERYWHSAVWDAANNRMLLFGGINNNMGTIYDDLWSYTPSSNTWTQLTPDGSSPDGRYNTATVWDPVNNRLLMFSGQNNSGWQNELWSFSGNTWSQLTPPESYTFNIYNPQAVWDIANSRMLVFVSDPRNLAEYTATNTWIDHTYTNGYWNHSFVSAVWDDSNSRMLAFGADDWGCSAIELFQYCP